MAKSKATPTKKTKTTQKNQLLHEEVYAANKEAIDTALRRCTGHLKRLTPAVARETISRLEAYYFKYGLPPAKRSDLIR